MDHLPWRVPIITAASIITSGLTWLVIYSLNVTDSIGFDGPAGGTLGLTVLAGWVIGAVIALSVSRPFSKNKLSESIFAIVITGLVMSFATGLVISQYALAKYPDGGRHFESIE